MRKHYKLISAVICLLLCVGMVAFGVYAARYNLISISSTVSFAPTSAKLKIIGAIDGALTAENTGTDKYYATNYGESLVNCTIDNDVATFNKWEYGKLTFGSFAETSAESRPDPICFYIQITNYVEVNTQYKITITEKETTGKVELNAYCYTELNSVVSTSQAGEKGMWNPTTVSEASNAVVGSFTKQENLTELTFTNDVAITPNTVNTELSTTMLVLKLGVLDIEADINFNFSFTISTQHSA